MFWKVIMNRNELAEVIDRVARIEGRFRLRSGAESHEYFDKYRFESDPVILRQIAISMESMIPEEAEMLAGLEMGGIPIATMLGQISRLPVLFVRKESKSYGTCKIAEGGDFSGKRVVVVEDVVTSGGQIIASATELRRQGAIVETVLCVIDRQSGGTQNLETAGLELRALFTKFDLEATRSEEIGRGTE
jgi:orotate phosphoribosyltransferase